MTNNYLANIRVLIADDQTFTRTLVREILRTLGCRDFREAANGVDAWKEIEVSAPDLAIIDWEMHPGNGLELTRRLRDTSQSPNAFLPIIMMTAHAEKGYVMQARDAGVTEYLIKPISAKAILRRISEVIEHPRSCALMIILAPTGDASCSHARMLNGAASCPRPKRNRRRRK